MAGRALIGVVVGGFWSMSAATAMQLVPPSKVPRALAIFNSGNALATVVAAPLGSYLASIVGWRGAFFCLVPIAVIAFVWQWFSLPTMKAQALRKASGNVFRLFRNRLVVLGMLAVGVFFMGQFALFTYLRPFLETVTQVDVSTLSLVLLTLGVAGFVGTTVIGRFLKIGFYGTLAIIPVLMAAIAVALMALALRCRPPPCCWASGAWWPPPRRWAGGCGSHDPCRRMPRPAAGSWWQWCSFPSRSAPRWAACCSMRVATGAPSPSAPACCW
jgi:predicted MFS family arabinose efflux permease